MVATLRSELDLFGPIEHEVALASQMLDLWRSRLRPRTGKEEWLFIQIVVHTMLVERCRAHESAIRAKLSQRAALHWDEDRRAEAETLLLQLSQKPELTIAKLRTTLQGCQALIDRWKSLDTSLEHGVEWSQAQQKCAIDLLGTPIVFRHPRVLELPPRALVAREIAKLERHIGKLGKLDAMERKHAREGFITPSKDMEALLRYESACARRLRWAKKEFDGCRLGKLIDLAKIPPVKPPRFQNDADYEPMPEEEYRAFESTLIHRLLAIKADNNSPTQCPPSSGSMPLPSWKATWL